jgi:hypothetical protein
MHYPILSAEGKSGLIKTGGPENLDKIEAPAQSSISSVGIAWYNIVATGDWGFRKRKE